MQSTGFDGVNVLAKLRQRLIGNRRTAADYIAALILVIGIVLLLQQYLLDRTFWNDEALLANNIVDHPLGYLLTQPMDYDLSAPHGFLFLLKAAGLISGNRDMALRFIPLLSGLGTIIAAALLKNKFRNPATGITFLCLIVFSPILIYYSSELKPYAFDVFFAILLTWIGLSFRAWKNGHWYLLGAGMAAIFLSFPSVFVLASVGLIRWVQALSKKQYKELRALTAILATWLGIFAIYYLYINLRGLNIKFQMSWWTMGYAPLQIDTFEDIKWYIGNLLGLARLVFEYPIALGPQLNLDEWFTWPNLALLTAALLGGIHLSKKNQELFYASILPIGITLLVSGLKLYPFSSRAILFLIPSACIMLSGVVDWLMSFSQNWIRWSLTFIYLLFMVSFFKPTYQRIINPIDHFNLKAALEFVQQNKKPGDKLVLSAWSWSGFNYYDKRFGLQEMKVIGIIPPDSKLEDFEQVLMSLCQKQKSERTWFVFSHGEWTWAQLIPRLSEVARPVMAWGDGIGAKAFLYDLAESPLCP